MVAYLRDRSIKPNYAYCSTIFPPHNYLPSPAGCRARRVFPSVAARPRRTPAREAASRSRPARARLPATSRRARGA